MVIIRPPGALLEPEASWRVAGRRASALMRSGSIVTAPRRIYCRGANYRQHMRDCTIDFGEQIAEIIA
jgi:hypothetical protein